MNHIATIDISDLRDDGQAKSFAYTDAFGRDATGIVLRWRGELLAYRNRCPHWAMPIDCDTGEFFDDAHSVLQCKMHGARFDPATGECILGPCDGQHLEALRVEPDDDGQTAQVYRGRTLSF